ncbi:DUF1376 domain-containing protein [Azospirillum sp. TSA6c]|uniref:YdaU family protein n=1 Tax=Azospirillum sp. TSA6c TaxID=709813 RepID=UPI000D65B3A9|nr:DUF1376 domain-containing protein [Azospirillum sp. TSA6c]
MKRPDSWMPLYIGDYLADTGRLTTEGHGAYLLLIMEYWRSGEPLPDDDEQLASITRLSVDRWAAVRRVLERFFEVADGLWRHTRVDAEMANAGERYAKAKAKSDAAIAAREAARREREEAAARAKVAMEAAAKATKEAIPENTTENTLETTLEVTPKVTDKASMGLTQPQPQSTYVEDGVEVTRPHPLNPAVAIIQAFDAERIAAFGENMRRAYPHSTDKLYADRWIAAGADAELCRPVFLAVCREFAGAKLAPPNSLKFFDARIANALAERNRPMPEGRPNATRPAATREAPEHAVERRRDALAGAVARKLATERGGSGFD